MLVYKLNDNNTFTTFDVYKDLKKIVERNKLDIIQFEIPKDFRYLFKNEQLIQYEKQFYIVKYIEDMAETYRIECHQDIGDWYNFNQKGDFPYNKAFNVLNKIKPAGWTVKEVNAITETRTIKADHKQAFEVLEECLQKYDMEYRLDNFNKILMIGKDLGNELGSFFMTDFNISKQDINVESFEFATRIIPEGMNGLKINQINDGKDYLENKAYSDRTITYYWKDERYTNIQNLKSDAQKKLDVLSRPTLTIDLQVQDLNTAIGTFKNDYNVLDYVFLIDKDRKTKEKFKIIKAVFYNDNPFNNEITLNNKPRDLVIDDKEVIELTEQMWEYTRTQFDAFDGEIKGTVETAKRYTDDSFKTYKSERVQVDNEIKESITERTTYVDPITGQTKPIVDKALDIVKTIDGIEVNIQKAGADTQDLREKLQKYKEESDTNYINVSGDLDKYVQEFNTKNATLESNILAIRTETNQEIANSESDIKRYVSENFSTISQTDQKITLGVSSLQRDMDDLESKVQKNSTEIVQTNNTIDLNIKSINRDLRDKVDSESIITAINASREGIKIKGNLLDIDTSKLNIKVDEIKTTWSRTNSNPALYIKNSNINFYNEDGNEAGEISTNNYISSNINNIAFNHDPKVGTISISYDVSDSISFPYIVFDKNHMQNDTAITVNESIEFNGDIVGSTTFKGDIDCSGYILSDGGFTTDGESSFNGSTTFRGSTDFKASTDFHGYATFYKSTNFYDTVYMNSNDIKLGTGVITVGPSGEGFNIKWVNYSDGDRAIRFEWTSSVWFEFRKSGEVALHTYKGSRIL